MQGEWWASPSSVQGQELDPFQPGISYSSMNFSVCREIPSRGGNPSPGNVLQPFASSLGCLKVRVEQNFRNKSNKPSLAAPGISFQCHLKPVCKILIKPCTNKTSPLVLPTEHRAACRGWGRSQHQAQLLHLNPV